MATAENRPQGAEEIIRERKKRILSLKTLVFFILSSSLLVFLVSRLELRRTLETLSEADPAMLVYASLAYVLSNYFKSLRYQVMLRDLSISTPKMFAISGYQNFFNQILPARTGELTLVYYLNPSGEPTYRKGFIHCWARASSISSSSRPFSYAPCSSPMEGRARSPCCCLEPYSWRYRLFYFSISSGW